MIECELVADRMPAVAGGRSTWRPAELAHLEGCPDCAMEWRLVQAAQAHGAQAAAGLDSTKIAREVGARLRAPRAGRAAVRRRLWWLGGLAAAASVALVARLVRGPAATNELPDPVPAVSVLHELDQLTVPELERVLESMPASAESIHEHHFDENGLGELNAGELERILRSLEG